MNTWNNSSRMPRRQADREDVDQKTPGRGYLMGQGFVDYSESAGKILANLQALELLLRQFLYDKRDPPFSPLVRSLNELSKGDAAPLNPLTDWSSLPKLIGRYNHRVGARPEFSVTNDVVTVRDVLAHGRVWLPDWHAQPDAPVLLLKFAQPSGNTAEVEFSQSASAAWLDATLSLVAGEVAKVITARQEL